MTATDDGWQVVSRGTATRLQFNDDGDMFEGVFEAHVEIPDGDDTYRYLEFTDAATGELVQISESYQLRRAFADMPAGTYVRITRKREIPMGGGRNPMIDYLVEARMKLLPQRTGENT